MDFLRVNDVLDKDSNNNNNKKKKNRIFNLGPILASVANIQLCRRNVSIFKNFYTNHNLRKKLDHQVGLKGEQY